MRQIKNVILLTIDTLRLDVLGCYGALGYTPFIDSIQNNCIRFTRSQAVGPYTQASFPGILTSNYFLEYDKSPNLSPKATLVSEPLKSAGVYTAAFHSNPYLNAYFGWNRGWNHFYDSMQDAIDEVNPYIKGNVINGKVNTWLSSHVSGGSYNPFFLWVHYMDLHEPYAPDNKFLNKVDDTLSFSISDYMKLFKGVILPRDASDLKIVELLRKLYMAHVIEIDGYVQSFFDILRKTNVLQESIVIITSDHGEEFAEHGSLSHNGKMYAELINVPLLVYDPRLEHGSVCDNLVSGIDISPTILDIFGVKNPSNYKGQSLFPEKKYVSKGCYGECIEKLQHKMRPTDKPVYYYRENDVKVIYCEDGDKWEIYNLQIDPHELNNIADSFTGAEKLKKKLMEFINRRKQK